MLSQQEKNTTNILDPTNPDTMELAKVTDYVVSYGSKGTEHATEEEKQRLE